MTREQIIAHLDEIRNTTLFTKTMLRQMIMLKEWEEEDLNDEAGIRGMFFVMVSMSIYRVIVLECYKLIWNPEHLHLDQFLNQLLKYYDEINPVDGEGNIIDRGDYVKMIRVQKQELKELNGIKENIKEQRNNLIAHSDEEYFLVKQKVGKDYPISWTDMETLLNLVGEIIRKHYSLITEVDIDMRTIHSPQNIRSYLVKLRAHNRFMANDNIKNIRKTAFYSDDYNPEDIFSKSK